MRVPFSVSRLAAGASFVAVLLTAPAAQASTQYRVEGKDFSALERPLAANARLKLSRIPLIDGEPATLELERFDVMAPNAEAFVYDAEGKRTAFKLTPMRFFRGRIAGVPDSLVFLSITDDTIEGLVMSGERKFTMLSRRRAGSDDRTRATQRDVFVEEIPPQYEFTADEGYSCGYSDELVQPNVGMVPRSLAFGETPTPQAALTGTQKTVLKLVIESDSALYANFSSNLANTETYLRNLTAAASTIYLRDLDTELRIVHLGIRTTTDPWTVNPNVSTGTWSGVAGTAHTTTHAVLEYGDYWYATPPTAVQYSAAMLISGQSSRSGIAWTDNVCSGIVHNNPAYYDFPYENHYRGPLSYCGGVGLSSTERTVPNPDANVNFALPSSGYWPLLQFAHELGHTVRSPHTHCISVSAATYGRNFVDHCSTASGCYSSSTSVPAEKGTIMSYCHNVGPGYGTNSRFTFGQEGEASTQVINLMRTRLDEKTPVLSSITAPASVTTGGAGTASVSNIGLSYEWSIVNGTFTGGGTTATGASVNFTASAHPLMLTVMATNINGCAIQDTINIAVTSAVPCNTTLAPTSRAHASGAASGQTVGVTSSCSWTATSNAAWLTVTGGAAGSGNGTVTYSVAANSGETSREGTLTIGDETFTVTQSGVSTYVRGDFNRDGDPDIFWQHSGTAQLYLWLMDGVSLLQGQNVNSAGAGWRVAAVHDFNGDGESDLLWQNTNTSQAYIWYMDGNVFLSGVNMNNSGSGWSIVSAADFDLDGDPDVLWQHNTTGQLYLWYMNANQTTGQANMNSLGTGWTLAGTGDFNGDDRPDLVWRNQSTGANKVWYMNQNLNTGEGDFPSVATGWRIAAVGDYNGDSYDDLVFQLIATGQNYVYFMNGTTKIGESNMNNTGNGSWEVVAPR